MIAGEITAEQTTIVERAEAKAARLDALAEKRTMQTGLYLEAANRIASRLCSSQPVLANHHSESKALRAQKQFDSAVEKAQAAAQAVGYWNHRATAVEHHANRKSDFGVRSRRIEALLKDLRKLQSYINHGHKVVDLWEAVSKTELQDKQAKEALYFAGIWTNEGRFVPDGTYDKLKNNEISTKEAIELGIRFGERSINNSRTLRRINHTLNRLDFERYQLGLVFSYDQKLTGTIIQAFLRQQGADKPSAKKAKGADVWSISSSVPLPLHIADGKELTLTDEEVIALMQATGYEVPAAKEKAKPILNFQAQAIRCLGYGRKIDELRQISLTKEEYSNIYKESRSTKFSACGAFRVKVVTDPFSTKPYYQREYVCVYISDSKNHDLPESDSIIHLAQIEAA